MPPPSGKFLCLRPDQLTLPLAFPQREMPAPNVLLKNSLQAHGLLTPLVVRAAPDGSFSVLDGRRRLKVIWELAAEGQIFGDVGLPCFVVSSASPLEDVKLFLTLNQSAGLTAGDVERIQSAIEEAQAPA